MKHLKTLVLAIILIVGFNPGASAQINEDPSWIIKPREHSKTLFKTLKPRIEFRSDDINKALTGRVGEKSKLFISPEFTFEGDITANVQKSTRLKTVLIKSTNFKGALLTLSQVIEDDGSITYTGRIIHPESEDAYVLVNENGKYYFEKTNLKMLMVE
ncbi:MAG TPA: hypothetical protein VIK74_06040 [Parasegetibacter sp.]|jgi:hypothetical protein